jgi:hypothetical protein
LFLRYRIREYLDSEALARVLPKSVFAEALNYLRNHWDALNLFVKDGCMPIDNNDAEQLMKQIAVGRKNWLFIFVEAAPNFVLFPGFAGSRKRLVAKGWWTMRHGKPAFENACLTGTGMV